MLLLKVAAFGPRPICALTDPGSTAWMRDTWIVWLRHPCVRLGVAGSLRLSSQCPGLLTASPGNLVSGRGVALLRGFPTDLAEASLERLLQTLGRAIGVLLPQNPRGETCVRVADESGGDRAARGYRSNVELAFHSDSSDVLVLFCVRAALSGGENAIVSSMAMLNALLASNETGALDILRRGFVYGYPDGERTERPIPILSLVGNQWSCRYLRAFIELGVKQAGTTLSVEEIAALDHLDSLALDPSMHVYQAMGPGDVMFLNNHTVMHSRTAFEDHPEPSKGRLLLRLWLQVPGIRNVDPRLVRQAMRFTTEAPMALVG